MKKITTFFAALFVAAVVQAQDPIVLSQTSGNIGDAGVACANQTAMTTGDNVYFREYNLDDHGITSSVSVVGAEFAVSTYIGAPIVVQVQVFEYEGFPGGFDITNLPEAIVVQGFEVDESAPGTVLEVLFDDPVDVAPGSTLVVGIFEPAHDMAYMYLGTADEETKESYLASEACGITTPATVGSIGFPDSRHIINLVVEESLSVNDNLAGNVAIYPNPTTNVFNIDLPAGVEVTSSSLVDITGRITNVQYNNGQMNVSALAQGVYFLNLETTHGSFTQKVVKQ